MLLNQSQAGCHVASSAAAFGAALPAAEGHQTGGTSSSHHDSNSSSSRLPQELSMFHSSKEYTKAPAAAAAAAMDDFLPVGIKAETLDGRVPTLAELRQRKHVLKQALQQEDHLKLQLKQEGQKYSQQRKQQWAAMYEEYKEIKGLLQQVEEGRAASAAVPGADRNRARPDRDDRGPRRSREPVETIDLT